MIRDDGVQSAISMLRATIRGIMALRKYNCSFARYFAV